MRQPRTTENLKDRLWESLFQLMEEKPYATISISEIAQKADVGRATFYRHFDSKDDLIIYAFRRILNHHQNYCSKEGVTSYTHAHADEDAHSQMGNPNSAEREHLRAFAVEYFTTLSHYKHILQLTYEQKLDYLLFASVYRSATDSEALDLTHEQAERHSAHFAQTDGTSPEQAQNASARIPYVRAIHAASAFAMLDQWISSQFRDTPETLASILADIVFPPTHSSELHS